MISLHFVAALLVSLLAVLAANEAVGCYSSVDTSVSQGYGQYETQSLCASNCGASYPYVAIKNGGYCFCLSSLPSSSQVLSSQCSVPCNGFGSVMCGGENAYTVFYGLGKAASNSVSSLIATSTATSNQVSSSSSQSSLSPSKTQASSTSHMSPSVSELIATTSDANGSIIYRTVTQTSASSSATGSSDSSDNNKAKSSSSNVAPIVGGVVGGLAALALIGVGIFFFLRRRNLGDDDDEEDFYEKGGNSGIGSTNGTIKAPAKFKNGAFDRPMSNPFVHPSDDSADKRISRAELTDPRLNPVMMGRRRLSEGSLADEADYSRKILSVANP